MENNVEFIRGRLRILAKRIKESSDYQEYRILKKILSEISKNPLPIVKMRRVSVRKFAHRDHQNSPASGIKWGQRIEITYDRIEEVVRKHGGMMTMDALIDIISKDPILQWNIDLKMKVDKGRLAQYVNLYNRDHEDNQRLQVFPERKIGDKRVGKYTHIELIRKGNSE